MSQHWLGKWVDADDDARRVRGEYDIIMERRRNAAAKEKEKRERKKALADMSKKEKEGKKDKSEKTSERKQKVRGGVARVRVGRAASRSARRMQRRRSSTITACGCCKSCRERAMMALSHGSPYRAIRYWMKCRISIADISYRLSTALYCQYQVCITIFSYWFPPLKWRERGCCCCCQCRPPALLVESTAAECWDTNGIPCNPIFTPFLGWRFDDERAIVAGTKMALSLI